MLNASILNRVKVLLGVPESDTSFDLELIGHINGRLGILAQVGAGNAEFVLLDDTSVWSDFLLPDQDVLVALCASYVGLGVKNDFDPPPHGFHQTALTSQIQEYLNRVAIAVELLNYTPVIPTTVIDGGEA